MNDFDVLYKLVIVGDAGVGKTNLLAYFLKMVDGDQPSSEQVASSFRESKKPTIGVEFGTKTVVHPDGTRIRAQIWDTAGQERYRAITSSHYRRAAGALLVYDVTNRQSFHHALNTWLNDLREAGDAEAGVLGSIMLVGNKIDLENNETRNGQQQQQQQHQKQQQHHPQQPRNGESNGKQNGVMSQVVTEKEHREAAAREKLYEKRASAKTGVGAAEAFTDLLIAIHNNAKNLDEEEDINQTVVLGQDSTLKGGGNSACAGCFT